MKRRNPLALRTFVVAAGSCGAFLVAFLAFLFILQVTVGKDLPPLPALQSFEQPTSTVLLTRSGEVLHRFFEQNRTRLSLEEVPIEVVQAFLATEDRPFFEHWGIHLPSILRAALRNVRALEVRQGGSTITQQLARDLFLTKEVTLARKVREALLALRLEQAFTKEEILEIYLNQVYLGAGAYGMEAAARAYFGKELSEVTVGEAAMLAGLPAGPYLYDPRRSTSLALQRKNHVLRAMLEEGSIDSAEYRAALTETLSLAPTRTSADIAPYFVEEVRREILRRYGAHPLYRGGLRVYTTLDLGAQAAAESVLEAHLSTLEEEAVEEEVEEEVELSGEDRLQGAIVAMDVRTGAIIAMVGGRDFEESEFNRATQARRQAGSSIKAFVYGTALERGLGTSHLLLDTPITMDTPEGLWQPRNYDGVFKGPTTVREAWKFSRNVCAVRLFMEVGADRVIEFARRLGITTPILPYPSTAIGAADVIPLEMVRAYAVFANGGTLVEPILFTSVVHPDGRREEFTPEIKQVLDSRIAYMMMDLLKSTIDGGSGWAVRARGFDRPAGGKTGTTNDYTDAWFVGCTRELAAGVWVGYDVKQSIGERKSGGVVAAPIWADFMKQAVRNYAGADFPQPDGVVRVTVCTESGLLARPDCPEVSRELFLTGREPTKLCDIHGARAAEVGSLWELQQRERAQELPDI
jgi:penicillin-binding protein 1A